MPERLNALVQVSVSPTLLLTVLHPGSRQGTRGDRARHIEHVMMSGRPKAASLQGGNGTLTPARSEAKTVVQRYWDSIPCGSREPAESIDDPLFFRSHSQIRYEREPEILTFADFECWKGRRVLEIGVGLGADFVQFSRAGARAVGIDLSHQSVKLARRNAQLNHAPESLANGDAELLPFVDEAFDLVYSWGIFHHTPDTARAVDEVYRVLKPSGECRIMLYHRRSLVALQCYMRYGVLRGRPFAPLRELIASHMESPGTKAFAISDVRCLFRRFRSLSVQPVVSAYDLRLGRRRFVPRWMLRLVPSRVGWFLLISGRK
jgi:SAM-dependent methyltransferase